MNRARPLRTVSGFDTAEPSQLERQLAQFEQNVEDAIRPLTEQPWTLRPTNVKTAAYSAQLGELVVCKGTFRVTLPFAGARSQGDRCGVLVTSAGTITVASAQGNVQNAATDALATVGLRVYTAVGGNWWRAP